jgi:DNA-binding beta-propeller fold protein YncE
MKRIPVILMVMIVVFMTSGPTGFAGQDQKAPDLGILPSAVLEAFTAAYPKAVIRGVSRETEKGAVIYEIESVDGLLNRDLLYAADGKVIEVEEAVAPGALPAAVRQGLNKAWPGCSVIAAEAVTKEGRKLFELVIWVKDTKTAVTMAPDGTILEPAPAAEEKPGAYHLLKKHVLGGAGGWDYMVLDPGTRLMYVTHGDVVEILNVDTGAKGKPLTGLKGTHGVAFAPERNRAYVSNGKGDSVTVFDLATHEVLTEIPSSGKNPDAIMYDAFSGRVFTFNGRTANATAIDAETNKVVGTVGIGGKPEFAVTDGKGTIFVNNEDTSEVVAFDAKTLEVTKRWPIAPCEGPSGLAIDLANRRLFSVGDKVMAVSDFDKGKVVATVPIGDGPDAVRYDAAAGLLFASNGEGTLTVIRQESADVYKVLGTVPTARGARTMELDPKTHHVFVVTAEFGPAPAPTTENPRPRPAVLPGTFQVLEFGN